MPLPNRVTKRPKRSDSDGPCGDFASCTWPVFAFPPCQRICNLCHSPSLTRRICKTCSMLLRRRLASEGTCLQWFLFIHCSTVLHGPAQIAPPRTCDLDSRRG